MNSHIRKWRRMKLEVKVRSPIVTNVLFVPENHDFNRFVVDKDGGDRIFERREEGCLKVEVVGCCEGTLDELETRAKAKEYIDGLENILEFSRRAGDIPGRRDRQSSGQDRMS